MTSQDHDPKPKYSAYKQPQNPMPPGYWKNERLNKFIILILPLHIYLFFNN